MPSLSRLPKSPFLYPILDSAFSTDLIKDGMDVIHAGVPVFQIRAKNLAKARVFEIVKELEPAARERNICMIVNDFVDVALVSGYCGIHLGQEDFPADDCRRILPDRIIGISTHNRQQFQSALHLPVDYVAVGPIYRTSTKETADNELGPSFIEEVRSLTQLPIVCIGGIREENFATLIRAGADGIALISELYRGSGLASTISRLQDAVCNEKV